MTVVARCSSIFSVRGIVFICKGCDSCDVCLVSVFMVVC